MQRRAETETELWCGPCARMHAKSDFTRASASPSGFNYACKAVITNRNKRAHARSAAANNARHAQQRIERKTGPDAREWAIKKMLAEARRRARQKGLEFLVQRSDLEIPDTCPVFGVRLVYQANWARMAESASLDRFDSSLGYVAGNVWIISWRANQIKSDATIDELERLVLALKRAAGRLLDGREHDGFAEMLGKP